MLVVGLLVSEKLATFKGRDPYKTKGKDEMKSRREEEKGDANICYMILFFILVVWFISQALSACLSQIK